jgi:hypothetical protein
MKYQVDWNAQALNDLNDIWLDSPDRNAVTRASAELDAALTANPLRMGVPLESSVHRLAFRPPLAIEYDVIEDDRKVKVRAVYEVL